MFFHFIDQRHNSWHARDRWGTQTYPYTLHTQQRTSVTKSTVHNVFPLKSFSCTKAGYGPRQLKWAYGLHTYWLTSSSFDDTHRTGCNDEFIIRNSRSLLSSTRLRSFEYWKRSTSADDEPALSMDTRSQYKYECWATPAERVFSKCQTNWKWYWIFFPELVSRCLEWRSIMHLGWHDMCVQCTVERKQRTTMYYECRRLL